MRELLHTFGYLSADGAGGLVLSGGMVSDELGRLAQAYCVGGAELDELGAAGVAINIGEAVRCRYARHSAHAHAPAIPRTEASARACNPTHRGQRTSLQPYATRPAHEPAALCNEASAGPPRPRARNPQPATRNPQPML